MIAPIVTEAVPASFSRISNLLKFACWKCLQCTKVELHPDTLQLLSALAAWTNIEREGIGQQQ